MILRKVYIKLAFASLISLFLFSVLLSINPKNASALSGSEFQAGRIMDDALFFNGSSLSPQQIQEFLNAKVPVCDTNGTQPYAGTTRAAYGTSRGYPPPFTCLKDYTMQTGNKSADAYCNGHTAGVKSAAQIIYEVGQSCGISQRVLLVLLEKEQSLVNDDWPWSIQYRSATGYGCPDTAPCDAEYYGFFNQVYAAGRVYKYYAANSSQFNYRPNRNNYILYNPNSACGGTNVFIQNQTTAGLYVYTPYQPNSSALNNLYGSGDSCGAYGNRNFWRLYNDWFGTTIGTPLVRTATNGTYYFLSNSQKFAIPNADILYAYGLERTELTYVSDSYLASVPDGGMLTTIFTLPGDGTVYLADGNKRYGISSGQSCVDWGLPCGTSAQKELGTHMASSMVNAGTLQPLMGNQGWIYQMVNGKKLPFFSESALFERGYTFGNASTIVNFTNAIRPVGIGLFENNSFVKFGAGTTIYLYSSNKFYSFPGLETFKDWSGPSIRLFIDNSTTYNQTPPAIEATLSPLVNFGDGVTYLLDGGSKIHTGSQQSEWPLPTDVSAIVGIASLLPTKATLDAQSTMRLLDGSILKIEDQEKLPFNSPTDFFYLGFTQQNIVQLTNNSLSGLAVGHTLIAESRLVKKNGSETIYATGPTGTLLALSSLNQLGQFRFDTSNVPRINAATEAAYPTTTTLHSLIQQGSSYFVASRGERLIVPVGLEATYGVSGLPKSTFTSQAFKQITTNRNLDRFLQAEGGTIFYVENATKRPFTSFENFKQYGGTPSNTFIVPNDFINSIPTGPTI